MRRVSDLAKRILDAYRTFANDFHEYYAQEFDGWICSEHFGNNKQLLNYDHETLYKFIDKAILCRLGYTNQEPAISDYIYDMSILTDTDLYYVPLSKILDTLVVGMVPNKLLTKIHSKLSQADFPEAVIQHVMGVLGGG